MIKLEAGWEIRVTESIYLKRKEQVTEKPQANFEKWYLPVWSQATCRINEDQECLLFWILSMQFYLMKKDYLSASMLAADKQAPPPFIGPVEFVG